jgi:hypothetical protein
MEEPTVNRYTKAKICNLSSLSSPKVKANKEGGKKFCFIIVPFLKMVFRM